MPLSSIPAEEFHNVEAINTILNYPELFKIVTLINVPCFKELLVHHPNQPLVDSVVHGLTFSFWPFAHTQYGIYPTTVDNSGQPHKSPEQADFLHAQIQQESDAEHCSAPFGPYLLPGMYSTPILAVSRKGELHLCNHQSHGKFSLNSMIKCCDIVGVKLDGIQELIESLQLFRREHGNELLVIFKSYMKVAY